MAIETIPLSRLAEDPQGTLSKCADTGEPVVVELPDHRLVAIQSLEAAEEDDLVNDLLEDNEQFQELLRRSGASARKPFSS